MKIRKSETGYVFSIFFEEDEAMEILEIFGKENTVNGADELQISIYEDGTFLTMEWWDGEGLHETNLSPFSCLSSIIPMFERLEDLSGKNREAWKNLIRRGKFEFSWI